MKSDQGACNRTEINFRSLCAGFLLASFATLANAETLVVQGSTTFARNLMEPYHELIQSKSGHELTVIPNKSTPGLMALLEGRAHLAMISAPLDAEVDILRKAVPGMALDHLRAFEIARSRIAVVVNLANPVRALKREVIAQVLRGEIDNWKALGGPDLPIRVVLVGGGGGVTVAVQSELLSGQPAKSPNAIYVKTPVQLVQVVEQEPGALGFAQAALAKQRGTPEIALDKPLEQTLILVTAGEPTPAIRAVIDATRSVAQERLM
ncbi:substrate-binding domain-containing protein [Bradyrhizobium sp. LjRoot220]|uniref:substrate-binding domain-containing protein n=1 Tax=Bradyrhizobium sp. LjRoot220 TaxID=3342284 RepID=UPI003ECE667A